MMISKAWKVVPTTVQEQGEGFFEKWKTWLPFASSTNAKEMPAYLVSNFNCYSQTMQNRRPGHDPQSHEQTVGFMAGGSLRI